MLKKLSVVICGLGVVLMTAGGAVAHTAAQEAKAKAKSVAKKTAEVVTDAEITTAVKTKLLADKMVGGLKIDVDTKDGVVTLTGPVKSAAERAQARKLATNTKGVKRVISKLTIEPKEKGAGEKTKEAAEKVGEKTKDAAKKTGEVTKDAAKKTGEVTKDVAKKTAEVVTDASITTAVKTKLLADTKVGGLKIDVDTNDHVVTLTGNVKSAEEKAEALRLARTTTGVRRVVDKLTVVKQ